MMLWPLRGIVSDAPETGRSSILHTAQRMILRGVGQGHKAHCFGWSMHLTSGPDWVRIWVSKHAERDEPEEIERRACRV